MAINGNVEPMRVKFTLDEYTYASVILNANADECVGVESEGAVDFIAYYPSREHFQRALNRLGEWQEYIEL